MAKNNGDLPSKFLKLRKHLTKSSLLTISSKIDGSSRIIARWSSLFPSWSSKEGSFWRIDSRYSWSFLLKLGCPLGFVETAFMLLKRLSGVLQRVFLVKRMLKAYNDILAKSYSISLIPPSQRRWRKVLPLWSGRRGSPPIFIKSSKVSQSSLAQATWIGVTPLTSLA